MNKTIYEKIWDAHTVIEQDDGEVLLYIDRHYCHEVTSPQAFEGLRIAGRSVRRPELTFATMDHNIPTMDRSKPIADEMARKQIEALDRNCHQFGIECFDMQHEYNGIVHIIGPELGLTLPGMTIVCGDSHTATHGALGALAFGIGTSEVEHVLATQTLPQKRCKTMEIRIDGNLQHGVFAKDVILAVIGHIGAAGGTGYAIEFTGDTVRNMSMEGRMTLSNMAIEAGARSGLISPDEVTFDYLEGRPYLPAEKSWDRLLTEWRSWASDPGCDYDSTVVMDGAAIEPQVTWGTSPGMVAAVTGKTPALDDIDDRDERAAVRKALEYMALDENVPIAEIRPNKVFIGACTNGRIEDLRAAARVAAGYRKHDGIDQVLVVPGSNMVKRRAEAEGLDKIFVDAGFEWREPGCSMCLAMNPDVLEPGDRCASTSNRNFEGRQGKGSRTHLVSPAMAAAAAIEGHFTDVRRWEYR